MRPKSRRATTRRIEPVPDARAEIRDDAVGIVRLLTRPCILTLG